MNKSVLSRSVIALASFAIGAAALAAVPASAATAADITRDQVLNAAKLVRADYAADLDDPTDYSPATNRALRVLANRACSINYDDEASIYAMGLPVNSGESVDGLLGYAMILDLSNPDMSGRVCFFGALAPIGSSSTLSGTAKLTTSSTRTYPLSGDVFVSPGRSFSLTGDTPFAEADLAFSASGTATKTLKTTTTKTVKTPKTTAQKKSAKKKYDAALKSAKKAYDKALNKAGSNKSKKAAAKKAYSKKKAAAKATYKKRIATSKVVKVTTVTKTPAPFDVQNVSLLVS